MRRNEGGHQDFFWNIRIGKKSSLIPRYPNVCWYSIGRIYPLYRLCWIVTALIPSTDSPYVRVYRSSETHSYILGCPISDIGLPTGLRCFVHESFILEKKVAIITILINPAPSRHSDGSVYLWVITGSHRRKATFGPGGQKKCTSYYHLTIVETAKATIVLELYRHAFRMR